MLVTTLVTLQTTATGFDMRQVLALDIPPSATGVAGSHATAFYREVTRRVAQIPGVAGVATGTSVPWRDAGIFGAGVRFAVEGYQRAEGEADPLGRLRLAGPRYFGVVGIPLLAGREFTNDDQGDSEPVSIVSQSVAQRLFPNGEALNRHMWWTDPYFGKPVPRRIVGVVADVDDENVIQRPTLTIYMPVDQIGYGGRLFVRTTGDPYALVPALTRTIRGISPNQPVERAATLEDVRAEVLSPERLNAFVFSAFAGIALLIALVGVAGVLAFSVSARTNEIGIRMSLGADRGRVQRMILKEGGTLLAIGLVLGVAGAYVAGGIIRGLLFGVAPHDPATFIGVAVMMAAIGVVACWIPALRAARIDPAISMRAT
jgi:predicted permease